MAKSKSKDKSKEAAVMDALRHSELRVDLLKYFTEHDEDPVNLLKHFAGRLRVLLNCDQVIYRDLESSRIVENSPEIGEDWCVPEEYCSKCEHADVKNKIYSDGVIEMQDCTEGYKGVHVHCECPVKSALSRVVYCDGRPAGGIAIHYLKENHEFTDYERSTLEEFSRLMSLSLSRYEAKRRNSELEAAESKKMKTIISKLSDNADYVYLITFSKKKEFRIKFNRNAYSSKYIKDAKSFEEAVDCLANNVVFEFDRKLFRQMNDLEYMKSRLQKEDSFSYEYREIVDGLPEWHTVTVAKLGRNEAILTYSNTNQETLHRISSATIMADFFGIYDIDLEANILTPMRKAPYYKQEKELHSGPFDKLMLEVAKTFDPDTAERWRQFTTADNLRKMLASEDKVKFIYYSEIMGGHWIQASFFVAERRADVPTSIILAFSGVDKEEETRLQRDYVISIMSDSMAGLYYANLRKDTLVTFRKLGCFGSDKRNETVSFTESFDKWVENDIYEPYRSVVRDVMSRAYIDKRLKKNSMLTVRFRVNATPEHRYHEMRISRPEAVNNADSIVLSIIDCHEEIMSRKEHRAEIQQNLKLIDVLASEYSSVYYIDLENDSIISYTDRDSTEKDFGERLPRGMAYTEAVESYNSRIVFPADREAFVAAAGIENLKKQLSGKKSFTKAYRAVSRGIPKYREMTFVKLNDVNEEPTEVVLGFINQDKEILARFVGKELYNDYNAIYLADLTEDYIIAIKSATLYNEETKSKYANSYSHQFRRWANFVDPEYRDFWMNFSDVNWVRRHMAKDKQKEYVYHVTAFERWFSASYRVLERDEDGLPTKMIITQHQLDTDRAEKLELTSKIAEQNRELEMQQAALEKALGMAEAANRSKTSFLNNMSHDIRTPMNAIIGYAGLAEKHAEEPDLVEYYLRRINQSSNYLLSLINNILDMSRIESGHVELSLKPDSIHDMLRSVCNIVNFDIKKKNLKLITDISGVGDDFVLVDRLRMNQVLLNVMSNAIKYTPEYGKINLYGGIIDEHEDTIVYEIRIRDNGMGMSKEFLETIYEPFTRVKSSTVSGIQGTGLGMAITKSIMDLFGGAIEIESTEGEGTEVTLRFGLKRTEDVQKEEKSISYHFEGKKILFVEDNEMNREIAVEILEEDGFIVDCAENGAEAVEKVKNASEGDYDLIIMDIQMPVMNGYEATREIRKLSNSMLANIPIIAMTADAFEEDRALAFEAGMNEHIAKPIDITKMRESIAKVIG